MAGVSGKCFNFNLLKSYKVWTPFVRLKSSAHVAMTDDCSTIVFWHPETRFPYEKSLPIPEKQECKSDSVLKIKSTEAFLNMLKPKRPEVVREELMRLTYSTKHIWFPRKFQFRRKKAPDPDRPYL